MAFRMVRCDGKEVSLVVRALMMAAIMAQRTEMASSFRTDMGIDESRKFDTSEDFCLFFFDGKALRTVLMS